MELLLTFLVLALILGTLVVIHEFGHFIFAKRAGIIVEEFAFGFGPTLFARRYGDTLYKFNIIPLGGYVKMLGDQDGSSFVKIVGKTLPKEDKEKAVKILADNDLDPKTSAYTKVKEFIEGNGHTSQDREVLQNYFFYDYIPNHKGNYERAGFWEKLSILLGGVFMNFLLGAFLFYIYFAVYDFRIFMPHKGNPPLIATESHQYFPILHNVNNQNVDEPEEFPQLIVKVEGAYLQNEEQFKEILEANYEKPLRLEIFSGLSEGFVEREYILNGDGIRSSFDLEIFDSLMIYSITNNSVADNANLEPGFVLLSFAGEKVFTREDFIAIRNKSRGQEIELEVINNDGANEVVSLKVPAQDDPVQEIGVGLLPVKDNINNQLSLLVYDGYFKYSSGLAHGFNTMTINAVGLVELFKDSFKQRSLAPVSQGVGSIVAITDITYSLVSLGDLGSLLNLTGSLSFVLAFMNILPIPLLDGGHVLFILIERLKGRPISDAKKEKIAKISFIILIGLTILIMVKDVIFFSWPSRILELIKSLF